ncbi:MAG: alcohol acetyltransferase, partial [Clostridia bacterium]|nr:alcohol acetyltransferase [Clostridia bacterium]
MSRFGYSEWRKLDNAALAFPAVTGKGDTRVFRFYSQLKEEIDGELLQKALDETMEKYPLFQAVMRKGLFWYYLEHRDIKPLVKEEHRPPCSKLFIPDKKSLLFEVSYYKNRINLEVFHALTDGTGAMHFLVTLTKNYLMQAHPEEDLPEVAADENVTGKDQEEDSFYQYYSTNTPKPAEKKPAAYQFHGEKLMQDEMHILEVDMPVKETLAKARQYGVSITVMIAAMMICSIHEEIPKSRLNKPIALMIPVNLRNYFPSQSMTNFFGWIEVGHQFQEGDTLETVMLDIKSQFEKELTKDRISSKMSSLVKLERNPFLRIVPLEIKKFFLMLGTNFGGRSITAVFSNIGVIKLPPQYYDYIEQFGIFTSTDSMQICS